MSLESDPELRRVVRQWECLRVAYNLVLVVELVVLVIAAGTEHQIDRRNNPVPSR
jgi:hypothetical protein